MMRRSTTSVTAPSNPISLFVAMLALHRELSPVVKIKATPQLGVDDKYYLTAVSGKSAELVQIPGSSDQPRRYHIRESEALEPFMFQGKPEGYLVMKTEMPFGRIPVSAFGGPHEQCSADIASNSGL